MFIVDGWNNLELLFHGIKRIKITALSRSFFVENEKLTYHKQWKENVGLVMKNWVGVGGWLAAIASIAEPVSRSHHYQAEYEHHHQHQKYHLGDRGDATEEQEERE